MAIRSIPLIAEKMPTHPITIGRVGENQATRLVVDVSGWISRYDDIGIFVRMVRPNDNVSYTANGVVENGVFIYEITNADTGIAGNGMLEIFGISGNKVVASATAITHIEQRLGGVDEGQTPPEPVQAWYTQAMQAVERVSHTTVSAESLPAGSEPTATVDDSMHIHLGIPLSADISVLTQEEYDLLPVKAEGTVYVIIGE